MMNFFTQNRVLHTTTISHCRNDQTHGNTMWLSCRASLQNHLPPDATGNLEKLDECTKCATTIFAKRL